MILYSKFYSDSELHLEDTTATRDRTRLLRNGLSGYILDGKIKMCIPVYQTGKRKLDLCTSIMLVSDE